MLENRTFILEIYEEIFYKSFKHPVLEEGNQELKSIIQELFEISIEAEEIDEIPYLSSVSYLFIDYYYAIIYYWIHDTSEQFTNTTVMIDKSLDVIYSLLQSGLISKFQDLISFVIKTHILNYVKPENKFTSETKKQTFGQKQKEPLK